MFSLGTRTHDMRETSATVTESLWEKECSPPCHLPLSRHRKVEGVEAAGDLELSADAGHAVKLRVVSAPERRHLRHLVTRNPRSRRQVRMRKR